MGYRSIGYLAIDKMVVNRMKVLGTPLPEIVVNHFEETFSESMDAYYYAFCGLKMYPGYPDVDELMAFMQNLNDEPTDTHRAEHAYIRAGEDFGDVEMMGDCSEYELYTEQTVTSPVGSM